MSIISSIRSLGSALKAFLHWPWLRTSWPGAGAIIALGISGASLAISGLTLYLQFWPRHDVTATILQITANPVTIRRSADAPQLVSVELALWNRGHRPAVISSGYLLFDVCQNFRSAQVGGPADPMFPFVISPGKVVLRTLDAYIRLSFVSGPTSTAYYFSGPNGKTESDLSLGSKCNAALRDRKRVYIGVGIEAMQSDGKLEESFGLGGLVQGPIPSLKLNDKYGAIRETELGHPWTGKVPKFIQPFSVIPAHRAFSTEGY